jgi:quercetin dioxygenase-like cupin family protein
LVVSRRGAALAAFALALAGPACAQPATTPIVRTETTTTGQPLRAPPSPFQLVVNRVDLPAGGTIPTHKHPWQRYVYVEAGAIRVVNHDTGTATDFAAGQVIVEAVDQWHEGRVIGDAPARLIVVDQVPPGTSNAIPRTPTAR